MTEVRKENDRPSNGAYRLGWKVVLVAVAAAVASFAFAALLVIIFGQKQEARQPFFLVAELDETTEDPSVWGLNFPLQYDGYKRTAEMVPTRFGGSEAVPRTPTEDDPRSFVPRSKRDADPRLSRMWAGYAFAEDYREARGHAYMLDDATFTARQKYAAQPGTCLNCHSSAYVPFMELGEGDLFAGFEKMNRMTFEEARQHVTHPVTCIDCHDPETMRLRITRPAFIEGIRTYKATQGIEDYDVNVMATRQEMRSYVCAQCHVEYYFKGEDNRLTFPWAKGLRADEMLEYFDEIGFHDWVHAETGAKVLKVQHPEFELWSQGAHSQAGVSCSDCHVPFVRVGAMKVSEHHIRSPLLNIAQACQTCHGDSEAELLARAERIQERTYEMRNAALDALMDLIDDIREAVEAGWSDEDLAEARHRQRHAQFYLDFVVSENSTGFHAGQESARLLFLSIDNARQGQMALRRDGD